MPEEFEGDLKGAVFWGAWLTGATFRDVDLSGARVSHALMVDVDIDATIDRLVVNGVDVTSYVHDRDPWHPLRGMLRPADGAGAAAAWAALEGEWAVTIDRARALSEQLLHEPVDGEWSFVQTLRHLVFAIDKWYTAPVLGEGFHPMGLPNSGSVDFPWPGLDYGLEPSLADVLAVRADRSRRFREHVATLAAADLERTVEVLENGPNPLQECVNTVLEEEFWHLRYARRDLERLERG